MERGNFIDTQNLKAFVEVADLRSFSDAAISLHITQPAVSKRIAVLENQLQCRLFDRISRTVHLTEAGKALLPKAERILQAVLDARRSIADLQGEVSGNLSIGISHHIGLHRLPPVLQTFSKHYPNVHFDIDFIDSEEAYEQVMHGKIELGVITLDPASIDPTLKNPLNQKAIWLDELVVTVAPDHPLAGTPNADIAMLSQYTAILPGLNTYTGQIIKKTFQEHDLNLNVSMATNYLETIKMMVSIGLGWSVLPRTMIDETITALNISDLTLNRTLGYVYHRNRSLSNSAKAFVEALKEASNEKAET
ncbi:MAG: DNA-binding transcriptional LysR family regulator [Oceanicoccus sp.]|jgi:DNA-binding transcriptional LysR family regulator